MAIYVAAIATSVKETGELFYSNPLKKMVAVRKKCFQTQNLLHFLNYVLPYIIYLDIKIRL
jgi:hypothetical protein